MKHHISEAQDLRLRIYKKKQRTDWFLIIALLVMLVIVGGWFLYVETESNKIVSEFPQGGWVDPNGPKVGTKAYMTSLFNQGTIEILANKN